MRKHITKNSSFETDVDIICGCPRLTKRERDLLRIEPSYIKDIIYTFYSDKDKITKMLERNPELLELFI